MKKIPFYLSIDFEDLAYDLLRYIGQPTETSVAGLELSYKLINNYSKEKLNNKKLTFFTTGTLARTVPDLLKQMTFDGHEISSHYNQHDLMFKQSNYEIAKNLEIAKESIYKACGKVPIGFRAPNFSITPNRLDIYKEINKFFKYDSSHVLNLNINSKDHYDLLKPFNSIDLVEFPILPKGYLNGKIQIKSGGTFFRLFPKSIIKDVMHFNHQEGFIPLIYLHPYDYLSNQEFWVPLRKFVKSKKLKSLILYFRQNQWNRLGNNTVFNKLDYILNFFEHQGPMSADLNIK